jgi:hypothetical protein
MGKGGGNCILLGDVCVCTDDSGGSDSENGFVQRDHAFPGGMVTPLKFIANGLLGFK